MALDIKRSPCQTNNIVDESAITPFIYILLAFCQNKLERFDFKSNTGKARSLIIGSHETQDNVIQHNDTQHNELNCDTQHNTQNNNIE
jgi:hypothetical protein